MGLKLVDIHTGYIERMVKVYVLSKSYLKSLRVVFLFWMLVPSTFIISQNKELSQKEIQREADFALQDGKFEKALPLYRRLLELNPTSPLLNFLVGYCYQNTDFGLEQSLSFLQNAIQNKTSKTTDQAPVEAYYYLGRALHANYQFEPAIKALNDFMASSPKSIANFTSKISQLIEFSESGKMMVQSKPLVEVENVFELNTKYSDKMPMMNDELNTIIFSTRRENSIGKTLFEDGQYDDNVFVSYKRGDVWTEPIELSQNVNTTEHESATWVAADGRSMIIVRFDRTGGSIYLVHRNQDADWGQPVKLPSPINNGSATTFGSFSPDGKLLYFVSDRKGGYGGTDIYVSEYFGNNTFGTPKNLGPKINTQYNEESPFVCQNGVLYFSSEGHTSIGGYDIFASVKDVAGNWQMPLNIGIPFNSVKNDFFFRPMANGQMAYLSSDREGTKGSSDIFKADYAKREINTNGIVAGTIIAPTTIDPSKSIEIKIKKDKSSTFQLSYFPSKSGKFNIILPSGNKFDMVVYFQGSPFYYAQLNIAPGYTLTGIDQTIVLNDIPLTVQSPVINSVDNRDVFYSNSLVNELITSAFKKRKDELAGNSAVNINVSANNNTVPDGEKTYSVRLGTSPTKLALTSFIGLTDVKELRDKDGLYVYYIGDFEYEWEAQIQLKKINEIYPQAEIFIRSKN
jgi:hypothetical protein